MIVTELFMADLGFIGTIERENRGLSLQRNNREDTHVEIYLLERPSSI